MEVGADDYRPLRMKFNRGLVLEARPAAARRRAHQLEQSATHPRHAPLPAAEPRRPDPERDRRERFARTTGYEVKLIPE